MSSSSEVAILGPGDGRVVVPTVAEWQSNVRFYSKSASQKLRDIADAFDFPIGQEILDDHEELATLRWKLQYELGRHNPVATKALTKLFFAYLRGGRDFLYDRESIDQLFEKLISEYRDYDVPVNISVPEGGQLKQIGRAHV